MAVFVPHVTSKDERRVGWSGGGDPSAFPEKVNGWLVTDDRAERIVEIRELARERGVEARVERFAAQGVTLDPTPVIHTSHPTYGYSIRAEQCRIVWAP